MTMHMTAMRMNVLVICEASDIEFHDFDTAEVDDLNVNLQTDLDEEKYVTLMI